MRCSRRMAPAGRVSTGWCLSSPRRRPAAPLRTPESPNGESTKANRLLVAEAGAEVVVDQTGRLHVGVHDRAAYKLEAALLQCLAHRVRFRARGRDVLDRRGLVDDRLAIDERPEVFRKAAELVLHREHAARIGDR